jgi:hypothetical protein
VRPQLCEKLSSDICWETDLLCDLVKKTLMSDADAIETSNCETADVDITYVTNVEALPCDTGFETTTVVRPLL